ncbi:MAG: apolipoprotein N-acyltransferase [Proteobacteria bacterium]|nr:apolipoprotein N-acyltransferase [Pseudomonadota bacterium]
MSKIQFFFKHYWMPFLSGVLIGTSWIPLPPSWNFIAWVPLFYWLMSEDRTVKQAFWGGWWSQFLLSLIGFHWVAYVAKEFGYLPWPVALVLLLLFAAFIHLYIPLATALAVALRKKLSLSPAMTILALCCLLSLLEQFWPSIFPWNMGYPLMKWILPIHQWADVVGFLGLSFLVYLVNGALTTALLSRNPRRVIATLFTCILVLGALGWTGSLRSKKWETADAKLKTTIVQANIGNLEKVYAEKGAGYQQSIFDRYKELSLQAKNKHPETQWMIWPESAFPDFLNLEHQSRHYSSQLYRFSGELGIPLLTGAYSRELTEGDRKKDYNALFVMNGKGGLSAPPYHKTHLLIFGEYTPLLQYFPQLAKYNPAGSGFGRGKGPTVLTISELGDLRVGAQICYESLYPAFSGELATGGAQVLVNLTNDSWFGPSFEPEQHLEMTLARAIETRRPLIRSTNTGISTVMDAAGRRYEASPLFKEWFGFYEIPYQANPPLTIYTQFGSWLPVLVVLLLAFALIRGRSRETS